MGCFPWFPRKKLLCPSFPFLFGKVGEDDANAKKYKGSQDVQGKLEGPGRRIGCHAAREHAHETGIGRKEEAPSAGHFSKGCAFDKMIVRLEAILMFF